MDKKKQSILKQEGRIPLQEMGLPDFPDDDTGTVTVTKSRRVSFGANFVKEFIVGSAISTQFYSEYEQAFSSSDSSNPNSSHSGILNQTSCLDDAINLCVKPTVEEDFLQVKKKLCLEKQQNSLNVNQRCNDKNWDFNVSNNSNIFAEKSNNINRSENFKHSAKGIKRPPSHNDSFVPGEKYFQNKQNDPELNSSKFNDNSEKKSKPGKFSSTICFSVDSPTADMEFTEGCISLAKSIFDKKNKEMTVYIQEKKGNEKKEGKTSSGDIIFDGSEVEMSLTKCVHDQSEDDSFLEDKSCGFGGPSSGIQNDSTDESRENIENIPLHIYPLNVLLNQNNKSEEDSELERSLFFPERSLTEMLNPEPLKTSGFNDHSLEKDNNEECNMELSICEPLKICTSNNSSSDKDDKESNTGLSNSEPLKTLLSNSDSSLERVGNEKCNNKLFSPELLNISAANDLSLEKNNNGESDMELSICGPLKTSPSNNPTVEKDNNRESDMELSICGLQKTSPSNNPTVGEDNNGESDMELSICGPLKTSASNNPIAEKDNNGESDMELSICGPLTTPLSNDSILEKNNSGAYDMELSVCEPLKKHVPNTLIMEKDDIVDYDMEFSICEPLKTTASNNPALEKHSSRQGDMISNELLKIPSPNDTLPEKENTEERNEELLISENLNKTSPNNCVEVKGKSKDYKVDLSSKCLKVSSPNDLSLDQDNSEEYKMELRNRVPCETLPTDRPSLNNDDNEERIMELSASEPLQMLVPDHLSLNKENNEECNMELSISEPFKGCVSCTPPLNNDSNEDCNMELEISEPSEIIASIDSIRDGDNIKECRRQLSPCGKLKLSVSNDRSVDIDGNEECNMEVSSSKPLKMFTYKDSGNECNAEDKKEESDSAVEDAKEEENNEVESSSKQNKYRRCSFTHVDVEVMDDINKEPEIENCGVDPLSVSVCREEDISLNKNNNENFDVQMMDSPPLKRCTYEESLREETNEMENNEIVNCSKDSSFSEVMKEAVEEVNNESFIKKSVIDLFRSTVADTDECLNANYNSEETQSHLKMKFHLESPVKDQKIEKPQKTDKIADELRKIDSVSEGDKKIMSFLREQAQEANCLWKVESFAHDGDCRCWSFSSSLLGNLVIMKFKLMPPKDMSVVSFSFILERSIELHKSKEFQSEKNRTTVEFAFEKMKNYFDPESRSLDNVHEIPLFLDRMNYFLARINKFVDQLVRIMKEYPGSRLKKSILSFRLHSFPLMFSLSVMVDVNDPLQLSESSVTFEKHFGNFSTTHIKSVFNDCLKSEEVLIQFIQRVVEVIVSEERLRGCITNRSYIRLVT